MTDVLDCAKPRGWLSARCLVTLTSLLLLVRCRNPWGWVRKNLCPCNCRADRKLCPFHEERWWLRTGNCRIRLHDPVNPEDKERVRALNKGILRACNSVDSNENGLIADAEMDIIIDKHFGTRTQDAVPQFVLAAHYDDRDMDYTFSVR